MSATANSGSVAGASVHPTSSTSTVTPNHPDLAAPEPSQNYRELSSFDRKQLLKFAEKLGLKLNPNINKEQLITKIQVEQTKQQLQIQEQAKRELQLEKMRAAGLLDRRTRPTFEEVAIYGGEWEGRKYKPSKRVIVQILAADGSTDIEFSKGPIYFHLVCEDKNGKPVLNCVPECLISESPQYQEISLAHKGMPVFSDGIDPLTGRRVSRKSGTTRRFRFIKIKDAPPDTPFGPYFEAEGNETSEEKENG